MKQYEQGFSILKMLALLLVLASLVLAGFKVFPVYNTFWTVEKVFQTTCVEMADASELTIRARLPLIFKIQSLSRSDLPQEFHDNLSINAGFGSVELSSSYHVIIWLLGEVEGVDPNSDYDPVQLAGMDKLRDQARIDLDFEVYAKTP